MTNIVFAALAALVGSLVEFEVWVYQTYRHQPIRINEGDRNV